MIDFQQKNNIRKILYSKVSLILLIFIIIILLLQLFGVYNKHQISKSNLAKTTTNLNIVKEKEEYLKNEIERLESKRGIEEEIREKYGFVKPGEEIIVILNQQDDLDQNDKTEINLWTKFLSWFNLK